MAEKLLIIDANSLLYRSYYALPPLKTKLGKETGGVYGFFLTLLKAIKEVKPDYIAACFDTKTKTFRHEKFEQYKIQRPPAPLPLISQIPLLKEVLEVLKIPFFEKEGFEADDLIATICKKNPNLEIYILSGDLDNLQLVKDKVRVYTLGKGIKETVIYDTSKVREKFGIEPWQIVDFKALAGDSSDNIPGVPGIGKKTAAEIIKKYKNLENLYQELTTDTAVLKPKVKKALKENKELAFLSLNLARMRDDVELDFKIENCKFGELNKEQVKNKFLELEFNSLINKIP